MSDSIPINIQNSHIKKLKDYLDTFFNHEDSDGNLDLDRMQRNVAYNAGNMYTNISGILFQEELKLAQIEADLKQIKAKKYDEIKRITAYTIEATGIKLLLDGSEDVRKKQLEYDRQYAYVQFLLRAMQQLTYYGNKIDTVLKREEIRFKYG